MILSTFFIIAAVVLRILSNPLANVFQKQLTAKQYPPLQVNFFTYLILGVFCIFPAFNIPWQKLSVEFWIYSILAGIAGATGNGFLVKALHKGDLSVLGPVNSYKSIVGMIVGIFLLGELPNWWGITGVLLIVYGSYFVLDTAAERFSWALLKKPAIQFRIWAMILTAIEAVFIKKIILASSTTAAFISWCWFGTLFSFIFLLLYKPAANTMLQFKSTDISKFLLLVICIGTMQFTTTYTFDHMPVGYALSLFQLSTIISVLLGHSIFKEQDIRKKLLGSFIMIIGSVIIILMK